MEVRDVVKQNGNGVDDLPVASKHDLQSI